MLVIPLQISPEAAFGASNGFSIPVSQEGIGHLSGPFSQSVFCASAGTYNLSHTCNTWTAEALRVAGLPISAAGVGFAGQVLDQLRPLLEPVSNTQSTH